MSPYRHFFIVGAQRSATTFLYKQLSQHPQVEMAVPLSPEPKFFLVDNVYEMGLSYYETFYFAGKPGAFLRGEKSTSYIESEKAAHHIAASYPEAKLIFVFREPVSRAISNYNFSVANGFEDLALAEAFLQEDQRLNNYDSDQVSVSPYAYLRRGLYIDHIDVYDRYFSPGQLFFVLKEQITRSPEPLRELIRFLGVESDLNFDEFFTKVNAGPRNEHLLSPELRRHLDAYFARANERLAERTGLDIGAWYK